jgi:hypothetical protein
MQQPQQQQAAPPNIPPRRFAKTTSDLPPTSILSPTGAPLSKCLAGVTNDASSWVIIKATPAGPPKFTPTILKM